MVMQLPATSEPVRIWCWVVHNSILFVGDSDMKENALLSLNKMYF